MQFDAGPSHPETISDGPGVRSSALAKNAYRHAWQRFKEIWPLAVLLLLVYVGLAYALPRLGVLVYALIAGLSDVPGAGTAMLVSLVLGGLVGPFLGTIISTGVSHGYLRLLRGEVTFPQQSGHVVT